MNVDFRSLLDKVLVVSTTFFFSVGVTIQENPYTRDNP